MQKGSQNKGHTAANAGNSAVVIHDSRRMRSFLKGIGAKSFIDRNLRKAGKGKVSPMSRIYRRIRGEDLLQG